jgi:AcrR family transcriptional regulator
MVRIVKEEYYAARRNEILDVAYRLIYTKGYEQMTIQDILDNTQISKGAFYHYFDSKQALLEALCDRLMDESEQILLPVVQDESLSAVNKLNSYFSTGVRWKTTHKTYLMKLLYTWYADDNAIVRQKVSAKAFERIAPLLSEIIQQGIQEGILTPPYPERVGEVILSLFQGLGDKFARLLLASEEKEVSLQHVDDTIAVYTHALERVLGAPTGSLHLMDTAEVEEWFSGTDSETEVAMDGLAGGMGVAESQEN